MDAAKHISNLMVCLERHVHLLTDLVQHASNMQQALTTMNHELLVASTKQQGKLTSEIKRTEMQRCREVARLTGQSISVVKGLPLSSVASALDETNAEKLKAFGEKLRELSQKFVLLHRVNRILTERSRKFTQETLRVLTNDGQPLYNVTM